MSKDSTFNPGDFVVYPAHGVGQVTDRKTTTVGGQVIENCLFIHFNKNGLTMKMSPQKALDSNLRQISTPVMMEAVENILRKKIKPKRMQWSKRQAEYEAKISSVDPMALADVVRKLYKDNKTTGELKLYEKAMGVLAPEYAIVRGIPQAEAQAKIEEILAGADSAE